VTFNRGDDQRRSLAKEHLAASRIYWIHLDLSKELNAGRTFRLTRRTCMVHFLPLVVLHVAGAFSFADAL
jgi:hypothetical protein